MFEILTQVPAEFVDAYFNHQKPLAWSRRWSVHEEVAMASHSDAAHQVIEESSRADAVDLPSHDSWGLVVEWEVLDGAVSGPQPRVTNNLHHGLRQVLIELDPH